MKLVPEFAVVGHPNKGKSSIVATLAQSSSVEIGPDPGTTTEAKRYPMIANGQTLYMLIDTPGFQRARKLLHWLKQRETTAAERPELLRRFVDDPSLAAQFPDEQRLLKPIAHGAGVLYVVDGSVPYGVEYEAEMEILRWSGQPSMALINPIGSSTYVPEWRSALGQYFSVVRVFDALVADFSKQLELLETFGRLREEWTDPLQKAVNALRSDRLLRLEEAARFTSEFLLSSLTRQIERKIVEESDISRLRIDLEKEYQTSIQKDEQSLRLRIERTYNQENIIRRESELDVLKVAELFSEKTWRLFGLSKSEILILGAIGGGAVGAGIDTALGGASMLLGTVLGGSIGAFSALLSAGAIAEVRILTIPFGDSRLVIGPSKDLQLPHIMFNRARLHHYLIAARTHAQRNELRLDTEPSSILKPLPENLRRSLERSFQKIRNGDTVSGRTALAAIIHDIYRSDSFPDNR